MTFADFVKLISNKFTQYSWTFNIEDGFFIAECSKGVVIYDPNTDDLAVVVSI